VRETALAANEIRPLLSHHDSGSVQVAADHCRKHGRVADAQAFDPPDFEIRRYDSVFVDAHAAGAALMPRCAGVSLNRCNDVWAFRRGCDDALAHMIKGLVVQYFQIELNKFDVTLKVIGHREIPRIDQRAVEGTACC
jgi:hypothetical protein